MNRDLVTTTDRTPTASTLPRKEAERLLREWFGEKSARTREAYRAALVDFARHVLGVAEDTVEAAKEIAEVARTLFSGGQGSANATVLEYKNALRNARDEAGGPLFSSATINLRMSAIKSLSRAARLTGVVPWSIEVPGMKRELVRDTRGPGLRRVKNILDEVAERRDPKGLRDMAIMMLLWTLALRRNEVLSLDVEHVDLGAQPSVRVLRKGKRQRVSMPVPPRTADALRAWLRARGDWSGPLFVGLGRGTAGRARLSSVGLWKLLKRFGARPHGFRHSVLSRLMRKHGPAATMSLSGHANMATLSSYNDQEDDEAARMALSAEEML